MGSSLPASLRSEMKKEKYDSQERQGWKDDYVMWLKDKYSYLLDNFNHKKVVGGSEFLSK